MTANDGEFIVADYVVITVTPVMTAPPVVTLTSPAEGSVFEGNKCPDVLIETS